MLQNWNPLSFSLRSTQLGDRILLHGIDLGWNSPRWQKGCWKHLNFPHLGYILSKVKISRDGNSSRAGVNIKQHLQSIHPAPHKNYCWALAGCASICASSYISITLDVSRIYSALFQDPFLQLLIFSQIWGLIEFEKKKFRLEKAGRAGPWAMRTAPWGRRNRLIIMLQGHFRDWENFLLKLMQYLTF